MAEKKQPQPDALKILSKIIDKLEKQPTMTKDDTATLMKALAMYEDFTKESKQIQALPVKIKLVIPAAADGNHRKFGMTKEDDEPTIQETSETKVVDEPTDE